MAQCPNCNNVTAGSEAYCGRCGARMPAPVKAPMFVSAPPLWPQPCPWCGADVHDTKFCTSCSVEVGKIRPGIPATSADAWYGIFESMGLTVNFNRWTKPVTGKPKGNILQAMTFVGFEPQTDQEKYLFYSSPFNKKVKVTGLEFSDGQTKLSSSNLSKTVIYTTRCRIGIFHTTGIGAFQATMFRGWSVPFAHVSRAGVDGSWFVVEALDRNFVLALKFEQRVKFTLGDFAMLVTAFSGDPVVRLENNFNVHRRGDQLDQQQAKASMTLEGIFGEFARGIEAVKPFGAPI